MKSDMTISMCVMMGSLFDQSKNTTAKFDHFVSQSFLHISCMLTGYRRMLHSKSSLLLSEQFCESCERMG